jgi:hypothetical protein
MVMGTALCSAQYIDDALRYASSSLGVGARSMGMAGAFSGVASDYSAIFSNPAGLAQLHENEFSFGLSNVSYSDASTFIGQNSSFSNSSTDLNTLGFVYPLATQRGSLVLAIGYNRQSDYTTALMFSAVNPTSSIVPSLAKHDNPSLISQLGLADSNGNSPYQGGLQQAGTTLEGGGLNDWSVAASIEAAKHVYFGATLTFISGSYSYSQQYAETDVNGVYSVQRFGSDSALWALNSFNINNSISSDISGVTATLGMLFKLGMNSRIGITVKVPTYYTVNETFSSTGSSNFRVPDSNGVTQYYGQTGGSYQYDVTSPFVFEGGASFDIAGLMLSGDVQYTDWTQMSYSNADFDPTNLNTEIKTEFQPTANVRVGGEYAVPGITDFGLLLRAGFAYLPTPYKGFPSSYAQKYITGGIGFIFQDAIGLNLAYAHDAFDTQHQIYNDYSDTPASPLTYETVHVSTFLATLTYRFE